VYIGDVIFSNLNDKIDIEKEKRKKWNSWYVKCRQELISGCQSC